MRMFGSVVLGMILAAFMALSVHAEELVVGTYAEFPPFEYTDDDDKVIGFDIDVVEAIGRETGFTPKWTSLSFAALIEGLESDRLDLVASGLTITEARQRKVDFSVPYFDVSLVMVVREGDPMVTSLDQLKDMKVAVLMGSTASVVLEKALGENALNVRHLAKYNEVFSDLLIGRADAVLVDQPMARTYSGIMGSMEVGTVKMHVEQYGFAAKKGNKTMVDRINVGLEKIRESGEFDRLVEKWFKN